ncbi:MAG: hypothetical protein ACJAVA_001696 [Flavobacteriaceae bacterium]|jgi:hypothetical protein
MKEFIITTGLFLSVCIISIICVFCLADSRTDEYYIKLTTPKQSSLIVGSSRAAQGIQPQYINMQLNNEKVYNYAFSRVHTPYGKAYLNSIKRKLDKQSKDGVFILEVNPWVISSQTKNPEDSLNFQDNNSFAEVVKCVNCNPNFEYLVYSYDKSYRHILLDKIKENKINTNVDVNGWCEVNFLKNKTESFDKIHSQTIKRYAQILNRYSGVSETRINYLERTIKYLQQYGTTYLVRLPVSNEMLAIENKLIGNFDAKMDNLSNKLNTVYLNFMMDNEKYNYIDSHHLDKKSGEQISKYIAEQIINNKNTKF